MSDEKPVKPEDEKELKDEELDNVSGGMTEGGHHETLTNPVDHNPNRFINR